MGSSLMGGNFQIWNTGSIPLDIVNIDVVEYTQRIGGVNGMRIVYKAFNYLSPVSDISISDPLTIDPTTSPNDFAQGQIFVHGIRDLQDQYGVEIDDFHWDGIGGNASLVAGADGLPDGNGVDDIFDGGSADPSPIIQIYSTDPDHNIVSGGDYDGYSLWEITVSWSLDLQPYQTE
jgi:hypothetical protein